MGSLSKIYSQEKLFGQIYTPEFIVKKILDDLGFQGENILGKNLLDPACGDGRFLCEIVKRIIENSPQEQIKENLEKIWGWDIDKEAIELCVQNLDELAKPLDIFVNWNIFELNSILKLQKNQKEKFDFIVGNPPYIRIQHLSKELRNYIQSNYQFCKNGSTDIYVAFFELAVSLLKENGTCGFITPNTFFYTETAKSLREYFATSQNLVQLTNYADIQLFENATTYSAITIFNKKRNSGFIYQKAKSKDDLISKSFDFLELKNKIWQLSIEEAKKVEGKKLGEIAKIHVGITTLCDKAYIFTLEQSDTDFVIAKNKLKDAIQLEKGILKPLIKGSTLKSSQDTVKEYILFPYKKINEKHQIIPEEELKKKYPRAYQYLLEIKEHLDKRDAGTPNPIAWYAFGRSQGLDTSFGRKIIFSPMNKKPNFISYENGECTFYSGYCIKYKGDFTKLLEQLNSERMQKFIEISGRDFRGGWKAYNKKIIENFVIETDKL